MVAKRLPNTLKPLPPRSQPEAKTMRQPAQSWCNVAMQSLANQLSVHIKRLAHRHDIAPPIVNPNQLFGNDAEHPLALLFRDGLMAPEGGDNILNRVAVVFVGELRQYPSAGVEAGEVRWDNAYLLSVGAREPTPHRSSRKKPRRAQSTRLAQE